MHKIKITEIKFSDVHLSKKNSSALRGYIANTYGDMSAYFHNHDGNKFLYNYPYIQYKVLNSTPTLVGIDKGSNLLTKIFMDIKQININDCIIPITSKSINTSENLIGTANDLYTYKLSDWVALNDKNYNEFSKLNTKQEKITLLKKILIGNILSFFKGINYTENNNILIDLHLNKQRKLKIKNNNTIAFDVKFTTNAILPNNIGLGRNTSKGFGILSQL